MNAGGGIHRPARAVDKSWMSDREGGSNGVWVVWNPVFGQSDDSSSF